MSRGWRPDIYDHHRAHENNIPALGVGGIFLWVAARVSVVNIDL